MILLFFPLLLSLLQSLSGSFSLKSLCSWWVLLAADQIVRVKICLIAIFPTLLGRWGPIEDPSHRETGFYQAWNQHIPVQISFGRLIKICSPRILCIIQRFILATHTLLHSFYKYLFILSKIYENLIKSLNIYTYYSYKYST